MATIGNTILWQENLEDLAQRWVRQNPEEAQRRNFSAQALAREALALAARARHECGLPAAEPIETPRQWEVRWKPAEAERRLREGFQRLDWAVEVTHTEELNRLTLGAGGSAPNTAMIMSRAAEERAANLRDAGLDIPFTTQDALVLLMAEELFFILEDEGGLKADDDVVCTAARHAFVQEILGLPFCPWVQFLA